MRLFRVTRIVRGHGDTGCCCHCLDVGVTCEGCLKGSLVREHVSDSQIYILYKQGLCKQV